MQQSSELLFATSNRHKYKEAVAILRSFGIRASMLGTSLAEMQSDSIKDIALKKAQDAYAACSKPVLVEDDGLFIDSLGGFPGPYSSFVCQTIGNKGILKLVGAKRAAMFVAVIAYCDGAITKSFEGMVNGKISRTPSGSGWGFDPIFIPESSARTFARLDKNHISHRYKALKKFSSWYRQRSSGQ